MRAVIDRVNAQGGVHGRRLSLTTNNDGFDAQRGQQFIQNYIEQDYFALPVVPSAEGLGQAIEAGVIDRAGIPVVGTDGMRNEQYGSSWVWPVATATVSTMRIMADYGYREKDARTFAIVYDSKYKFGIEGKDAFVDQLKALGVSNNKIVEQALDPDQPQGFGTRARAFNESCSAGCDMVAMLLLPDTARAWLEQEPVMGVRYTSGAQTLFTQRFANDCVQVRGNLCNGFAVWSGYNPPLGDLATGDVARYKSAVESRGVDPLNQFVQGAYLGMTVFVEALERAGPNLTRERLQEVLNAMNYSSGLSSNLRWTANDKWANKRAQSFSMNVGQGKFNGWNHDTGFRADPAR